MKVERIFDAKCPDMGKAWREIPTGDQQKAWNKIEEPGSKSMRLDRAPGSENMIQDRWPAKNMSQDKEASRKHQKI